MKLLHLAGLGPVLKPVGAILYNDDKIVEIWEMFDRFRLSPVRDGKDKNSPRLEHFESVFKCSTNRRNDVLKDLRRNNEIA